MNKRNQCRLANDTEARCGEVLPLSACGRWAFNVDFGDVL
jgi:hypothetical protein